MSTISLTINIGTLSTDVCLWNQNGEFISSSSFLPAGWELVDAVVEYLKTDRKLLIARPSAVRIIIELGRVIPPIEIKQCDIKGRSLATGMPASEIVTSQEIFDLLSPFIREILVKIAYRIKAEQALLDAEDQIDNIIKVIGDFRYLDGLPYALGMLLREGLLPDAQIDVIRGW